MEKLREDLVESYFQEKDVSKRNEILKQLFLDIPVNAKDIFTLDEHGNIRTIRDKEEIDKSWRAFWNR